MKNILGIMATALAMVGVASQAQATSINTFLSAPKVQGTIFSNTTIETFESLSAGNRTTDFVSVIGTYKLTAVHPFNIQTDNQYGSGTGNYMSFGAQSGTSAPFTLQFASGMSYFGFSWNAGDNNNGLSFYEGSKLIGRFTSQSVQMKLSAASVTAIDGTVYASSQYRGKPPTGAANSGENYAFINFIAVGGTFDSIVFDNSGVSGSGFETDNHTVLAAAPTPNGSFVFVASIVPEPSAMVSAFCSGGVIFGFGIFRTFRKRRSSKV